jgi:malonate-semialdehyde dehydrogenase (acetylating)/methylmalonate-semialdehyde dehydrogenase
VPKGVLNVIHGTHDCVNFICDNPTIKARRPNRLSQPPLPTASPPSSQAVSFVGGNTAGGPPLICHVSALHFRLPPQPLVTPCAGEHIYRRAGATGKRVQSNMAAKNHGIILPDATRASVVNAMTGAAFGAAGQRCMALPVGVFVGKSKEWIDDIIKTASSLRCGGGHEPDSDIGPLISPEHKKKVWLL